jgi:hypothetical protein
MSEHADFFYSETEWAVALYEKRGRAYTEVGIFYEGEVSRADAFEMFGELCVAVPPWQAVHKAIEVEETEPEEPTPAYEVRLINLDGNRVVATVLWEIQTIELCKADHKARNISKFLVTAELDLDDNWEDDDLPWGELAETGKINVIGIKPVDDV